MLLVVDVGNTQTHFGTFDGTTLVEHWRFATVRTSTADELGAALRSLLALRGMAFDDLVGVDRVEHRARSSRPSGARWRVRYLGHEILVVGPGVKTGLAIRYDNPHEIGADRLVNSVALRDRFDGAAVCVDFGTATTFDIVSAAGEYLGGVILPGIEISLDALTERGAKLPKIDLAEPRGVIGKSTVDAIRSGHPLRLRRRDRRDHQAAARGAGRRASTRSPPAGCRGRIVAVHRDDRRGRRPPHAHRPAPHPREEQPPRLGASCRGA